MPLAGQPHILAHHVFVLERIAVEESVQAVVQIALFTLLLQEGTVDCLGLAIDHLDDLCWSSIALGVVKGNDGLLRPPLPRELAHLKLQRLDHGIADQLVVILLRSDDGG